MKNRNEATNILRSWLAACKIPHEVQGDTIRVGGTAVTLDANGCKALISNDPSISLKTFHAITEKAGFGTPMPVDRGERPDKKVYNEPILARFRHSAFRGAPNNEEALKEWNPTLTRLSRSFFNHNYTFFKKIGYEVEDVKSYLQVWTTTYVHRYSLAGGAKNVENVKLLTSYLKQSFGELYRSLVREMANVIPDHDAANMNAPGFYETNNSPSDEWKEEHTEIHGRTPTGRKLQAAALLDEGLAAMEHDQMIYTLEYATKHPCPDTAKFATKKLAEHRACCELCK